MDDKRKENQSNRSSHDRAVPALLDVDFGLFHGVIGCGIHGDTFQYIWRFH